MSPIIYFIETHPKYDGIVTEIFQRVSSGLLEGVTSVITLTEVLIHPLRRGDAALQQQYSVTELRVLVLDQVEL